MEKVSVQKDVFDKALAGVLDTAKVPMRVHLATLKVLSERIKKHDSDNTLHQRFMLEHARQLRQADERAQKYEHTIAGHAKELERYKILTKGEPGKPGEKGDSGEDGKSVEVQEVVSAMLPHIPKPKDGENGRDAIIDEEGLIKKTAEYLKKNQTLDLSSIKGARDFVMQTSQKNIKIKFEELLHGGGSSSGGYQQPIGTVNGINQIFTWTTAPNVIVVDQGRPMQKVSSDGTINWTIIGTTVTLAIAPNFDVFGVA